MRNHQSASDKVLARVPEVDRVRVGLLANFRQNTAVGERPSDSARWAVRQYDAGALDALDEMRALERARIHRTECQYGPRHCNRCAEIEANRWEA